MSLHALAKGTSSGRYSQGGIRCWTESWSVSGSHSSHLINSFAKSQIDSSQGGIRCWTESWSVSGSHSSHLINSFAKSQIDSDITPYSYGHGAPPKVRCSVMIDDYEIFVGKLGASLKSRQPMKMPSLISRFVIIFCCKDVFIGIKTSCCDCPIDYPSNEETKTACLN